MPYLSTIFTQTQKTVIPFSSFAGTSIREIICSVIAPLFALHIPSEFPSAATSRVRLHPDPASAPAPATGCRFRPGMVSSPVPGPLPGPLPGSGAEDDPGAVDPAHCGGLLELVTGEGQCQEPRIRSCRPGPVYLARS